MAVTDFVGYLIEWNIFLPRIWFSTISLSKMLCLILLKCYCSMFKSWQKKKKFFFFLACWSFQVVPTQGMTPARDSESKHSMSTSFMKTQPLSDLLPPCWREHLSGASCVCGSVVRWYEAESGVHPNHPCSHTHAALHGWHTSVS